MSALALRRVDAGSAVLRQAVAAWRADGMAIDFYDPASGAATSANQPPLQLQSGRQYIAFQADGGDGVPNWQGLVRCDEWLSGAVPAMAALALPDGGAEAALALFSATPQPLSATFPYRTLTASGLVCGTDLQNTPLAVLHTPQATVWLRALPALPLQQHRHQALAGWAHDIPATLQFLLGASRLSRGRLARVVAGDVLLVTEHALRMRCNGMVLGWYSITDKGINVDEQLDELYEDSADASLQAAPEEAQGSNAQDALGRIPVRLEFVLQQNKMTIGELGRLHGGQLIDLEPDAEKSVLVLANGALLGRGELVQLEDRLGVEMIDIYGSSQERGDHAD
jgi:type III secretion protein Q